MSSYLETLKERTQSRRGKSTPKSVAQAAAEGDQPGVPQPAADDRNTREDMEKYANSAAGEIMQAESASPATATTVTPKSLSTSPQEIKRDIGLAEIEQRPRSPNMLYLDDAPTANDDFRFSNATELLKDMILQPQIGTPFVLGIDGQWGSGKTSLCLGLEKKVAAFDGVLTCWVNAWRFDDQVHLLAGAFVEAIGNAVTRRKMRPDDIETFTTELNALKQRAQQDATWLDSETESHLEKLLWSLFSVQYAAVARLILFLDDLDRCSPKQLDAVIRFLRPLIGAWGYVTILPCDQQRVLGTLDKVIQPVLSNEDQIVTDAEQAASPSKSKVRLAEQERERRELTLHAFLERIVRVWIAMPKASPGDLITYLKKHINESDDYIELIAHVVDGNPRRLKGMITAYNLTKHFVRVNPLVASNLQEYGLPIGLTTLKLFLLRHFWHELFDQFRRLPKLLLKAQGVAFQASSPIAGETPPNFSDPIAWQSTFDLPLRALLTLPPRFSEAHLTPTEIFCDPVNEIVNAALLCPYAVHKAEQRSMEILRLAGAAMYSAEVEGTFAREAARDAMEVDSSFGSFMSAIIPGRSARNSASHNESLAPKVTPRIDKDTPNLGLQPQPAAVMPTVTIPAEATKSPDDFAALLQAALGVGSADDKDVDDEAQNLDINKMDVSELIPVLQRLWMRARMARSQRNRAGVRRLAPAVRAVVARVKYLQDNHQADGDDLSSVSSVLGNIAVSFETSGELDDAEEFYKNAIEISPSFGGTHLQYADFLVDRGKLDEASDELDRGIRYVPDDRRIAGVRAKLDMKRSATNPNAINDLRRQFDTNPGNSAVAAAYLSILSDMPASEAMTEFERVCQLWWNALPPADKPDARRALADYYATHNRRADAITIYNEILKVLTDAEDRRTTLHNLATLEASSGDRASALAHWTEAYNANTKDAQVVAGFVSALINWNMFDLAEKVSSNQPIPNPPTDIPRMR